MLIKRFFRGSFTVFVVLQLVSACSTAPGNVSANELEAVYTIQGEGSQLIVRALTRDGTCPDIQWSGRGATLMSVRAPRETVPVRSGGAQADNKEAVFEVLTCESIWPAGATSARVAGMDVPAPRPEIHRIVIIADTGCRMKASEGAFQPCNDPEKWPFAKVAQSAAALKPDLVIHIGDIHYRESPCPAGNTGCFNSPWGYGFDVWQADFFRPAKPLLAAAPWVFVRGNHESCARAGQGWFRFMDLQSWRATRTCNEPAFDSDADYSEPYSVPVAVDSQLVVFDSSRTSGKAFSTSDLSYKKYLNQLQQVGDLAKKKPNSFFLSHHPLLAFAPGSKSGGVKPGGNVGLQSVFSSLYPRRLFPDGVTIAMHGHVHLFEAISFKSDHPTSLVMGNSGSANEGQAPESLPADTLAYPGAVVEDYAARSDYGFVTLDRVGAGVASEWLLTEYNTLGQPVVLCEIVSGKSRCAKVQ